MAEVAMAMMFAAPLLATPFLWWSDVAAERAFRERLRAKEEAKENEKKERVAAFWESRKKADEVRAKLARSDIHRTGVTRMRLRKKRTPLKYATSKPRRPSLQAQMKKDVGKIVRGKNGGVFKVLKGGKRRYLHCS